jgi:hypothetical protein
MFTAVKSKLMSEINFSIYLHVGGDLIFLLCVHFMHFVYVSKPMIFGEYFPDLSSPKI